MISKSSILKLPRLEGPPKLRKALSALNYILQHTDPQPRRAVPIPARNWPPQNHDIKKLYKLLMLVYHPDTRNKDTPPQNPDVRTRILTSVHDAFFAVPQQPDPNDPPPNRPKKRGRPKKDPAPPPPEPPGPSGPPLGPPPGKRPKEEPIKYRGSGMLLTYNNREWQWCNREQVWTDFLAWIAARKIAIVRWTATMEQPDHMTEKELCELLGLNPETQTFSEYRQPQTCFHLHLYVELSSPIQWSSGVPAAFGLIVPDVRMCKTRGSYVEGSRNQGHFYCFADKVGTVYVDANHFPWRHYTVEPRWNLALWKAHKLSHSKYIEYSEKSRGGFIAADRGVSAIQEAEAARRANVLIEQNEVLLKAQRRPFRSFVEVDAFKAQFESVRDRYKILIIYAPSCYGKSQLASSLFTKPYVQTVEWCAHVDLKGFNHENNDGIVFDNVNTFRFVLDNRGKLQGRNAWVSLADSATGCYMYKRYLHRVPIVITADTEVDDQPLQSGWIAENSFVLRLQQKAFI